MTQIHTQQATWKWTLFVYLFSFLCYFPLLLIHLGLTIPLFLINFKYLFVVVPLIVSLIFIVRESAWKPWSSSLFSQKTNFTFIFAILTISSVGILVSYLYSVLVSHSNVFYEVYPNMARLAFSCVYLYLTAFVEELAWRGFLFKRILEKRGELVSLLYVSICWSIWHVPMWTIRNGLGIKEVFIHIIATILISLILGHAYFIYQNIVILALLHMLFNICFLAPMQYNIIGLVIIICIILFYRHKISKS